MLGNVRKSLHFGKIHPIYYFSIGLLVLYASAIIFDLPEPAGKKYEQNLPDDVVVAWGGQPVPSAQYAEHWWYKTQGLRGWSENPEGWNWKKNVMIKPFNVFIVLIFGILGSIILWIEYRWWKPTGYVSHVLILMLLILFIYTFQLLMLSMKNVYVEQLVLERIMDKYFTGYFTSALQFYNINDYFSNYVTTLKSRAFCAHCRTHPPGPVLYYWSIYHLLNVLPPFFLDKAAAGITRLELLRVNNLSSSTFITAWFGGNLILLVTASIVIPLYKLANLFGKSEFAISLALLGAMIPGIILMSPEFDQLYAVFVTWILYAVIRALQNPKHVFFWGLTGGVLFAFSLFWSVGLAVILVPLFFFFAWIILRWRYDLGVEIGAVKIAIQSGRIILLITGFCLGCCIPWFLLVAVGKFPLLEVLNEIRQDHIFGITTIRPYVPWLFFNLTDFFQFLGLPLVLVVIYTQLYHKTRKPMKILQPVQCYTIDESKHNRIKNKTQFNGGLNILKNRIKRIIQSILDRFDIFGIMFWSVIILLDLSGTTRGEVGRLWIFLMPLAVLSVYQAYGQDRLKLSHIYLLLAAQFIACAFIGINWITP